MGRARRKRTTRRTRTPKTTHTLLDLPAKYFKRKREPTTPEEQQALDEELRAFCEAAWGGGGTWGDVAVQRDVVVMPPIAELSPPDKPARSLPSKKPGQHRKPIQEKIILRLREKYPPNGDVGDTPTADVHRTICEKNFNPGWDTVHRALGRKK